MKHERIDDMMLDTFVRQKYHWKSLTPRQQYNMAVELAYYRHIEPKLYDFIDQIMRDNNDKRDYRQLLGVDDNEHF